MNHKLQFKESIENQSKYPPMDKLIPGKSYAFTLNPDPEYEYKIPETRRKIEDIIPYFHAGVKVYTEISTKNQLVHYHGFINWSRYKDIALFYLNIPEIKKRCQFEIDTIGDDPLDIVTWWVYVTKSCPYMDALCHDYKTPNLYKYDPNRGPKQNMVINFN